MGNFKEDIARCEAFVFDVDGVMTDGGIIPTPDGDFIRRYNAKDGYALAYAIKIGYKVCIITGGRGRTLENRLRMLGIDHFYVDCMDKITAIREYMAGQGLDPANVIYMGDDIPDLDCMREVGLPVCPADAAADAFGALMGELFAYKTDRWADGLRRMGAALGRFIYMMDAYADLPKDKARGRPNPLVSLSAAPDYEAQCKALLTLHLGECALEFEKLPLVEDADILRNILYSGVWTKYEALHRQGKEPKRI